MSPSLRIAVVAVGAVLASAAPASAARVYGGQPGAASPFQGVVTLSDDGTRVTGLVFEFDVTCPAADFRSSGFSRARLVSALPAAPESEVPYLVAKVAGGTISGRLFGLRTGADFTETLDAGLEGTVTPTGISARLTMAFAWRDLSGAELAACNRTVRFRARRRPGIIYGGSSSQGAPVVLELTRDRRRVSHSHFSWFAPCERSGSWNEQHDEFDLRPLPLNRRGAFSRSYTFDLGDGWVERTRLAGRVRGTRASGTFRGRATHPTIDDCSVGTLTWTARTG